MKFLQIPVSFKNVMINNLDQFYAKLVLNPHYFYCSRVLIKHAHDVVQLLTSVKVNTNLVTERRGASRSWNDSKFVCLRA